MTERNTVLALYDSQNKLIGYKTDSFWTLSLKKEEAKHHTLENLAINCPPIQNLIYLLDTSGLKLKYEGTLYLSARNINTDAELLRYSLSKLPDGKNKIDKLSNS